MSFLFPLPFSSLVTSLFDEYLSFGFFRSVSCFRSSVFTPYSSFLTPDFLSVFLHSRFGLHIVFTCQRSFRSFRTFLSLIFRSAPETFESFGGDEGTRTPGLCLAKAPLSQLSYIPSSCTVGLSGLEPETSPLSEARSNQLS